MTGKQLKNMLIGEELWYTVITVLIAFTFGSLNIYGSDVVLLLSFYNHADPAVHTCPCGAVGTYPGALLSEYVQAKRGRQAKGGRIRNIIYCLCLRGDEI